VTPQQLVLIRHAKAADGPTDIERPLAPRGRRDAGALGRLLARAGIELDRVVVSPALRARQTWDGAQAQLSALVEVVVDQRIYDNEVDALFELTRDTPPRVHTLGLVGHNPSFAELAHLLDHTRGDAEARQELRAGYPTTGVAVFDIVGSWAELGPHSATLRIFTVARDAGE